jgi:hypothetical protein
MGVLLAVYHGHRLVIVLVDHLLQGLYEIFGFDHCGKLLFTFKLVIGAHLLFFGVGESFRLIELLKKVHDRMCEDGGAEGFLLTFFFTVGTEVCEPVASIVRLSAPFLVVL